MKKIINGEKYEVGENYKKPKKGICYKYKDGNYYIYYGKFTSDSSKEGLYNKDGKVYLHKNKSSSLKEDLINDILKNGNKAAKNVKESKKILSEDEKKDIIYMEILPTNNILVRLIKQELNKQNIPKKDLQTRFNSLSEYNNFIRALRLRDSITIEGFARWMEILNKKWKIVMEDL